MKRIYSRTACLLLAGWMAGMLSMPYAFSAEPARKPAAVAPVSADTVILSSKDSIYNITPNIRLLEVPRTDNPSFTQAMARFKQGQGQAFQNGSVVLANTFKPGSAYWLFFNTYNRSPSKTLWALDAGGRGEDSAGIADRLMIYHSTAADAPLVVAGRKAAYHLDAPGQSKHAVPINFDTGQNIVTGIYIEPAPGIPMHLTFALKEHARFVSDKDDMHVKDTAFKILSFLFVAALLAMWWAKDFKKPLPAHLAAYVTFACLIYQNGDILIPGGNEFLINHLDILNALAAFAAICLSHQVLNSGSRQERFALLTGFLKIILLTLAAASYFVGDYISAPSFVLNAIAPLATSALILVMAALTALRTNRPQAMTYAVAWLLPVIGYAASLLGSFSLPVLMHMQDYLLWPHLLLVSYASLRFLNISEDLMQQERAAQREKQEEEAEKRKMREMADQSRLLGVMQREKELMADLRNRESERAQALRKAKEIADQANKAKSDFLAVVSHEIRTPMTGIMGMIRLMLDTSLNERQKEFARTIQYSGETLLTLLNDILDLSKAEEGKMSIENIDFDIIRTIQSVAMLMSGRADEKKLFIKTDIDPSVPPILKGDPTRLRQILLNLVSNSLKFTEKGGVTISIKVQEVQPGKKRRIYFGVTDTGIGIAPENQKKLFQPYAQADSSTARKFGGTGLGLSICKKLVEAMGSTIQIQSAPGNGTTIYYILSMEIGELNEAEEGLSLPLVDIPPMRILVVDDNIINQRVVAGLLEKDKHTVITVGGASDAYKEIEKQAFDVILMDIEMPEIDGLSATRTIRALPDAEKSGQIIIAMTGNTSKEDIKRSEDAGMDDYLTKPINIDQMRKMLYDYAKRLNIAAAEQKAEQKDTAPAAATPVQAPASGPAPYVPVPPPPREKDDFSLNNLATPPGAGGYVPVPPPSHGYVPMPPSTQDYSSEKTEDALFDKQTLGSLRDSLGVDAMADMMKSLYDKTDELITATEKALAENDIKALSLRGHEMKGMTANFGITTLSQLGAKIEKLAKAQASAEEIAPHVQTLRTTYNETRSAIDIWLK